MAYLLGPDGKMVSCEPEDKVRIRLTRTLVYEGERWWVRNTLFGSIKNVLRTAAGTITVVEEKEEEIKTEEGGGIDG